MDWIGFAREDERRRSAGEEDDCLQNGMVLERREGRRHVEAVREIMDFKRSKRVCSRTFERARWCVVAMLVIMASGVGQASGDNEAAYVCARQVQALNMLRPVQHLDLPRFMGVWFEAGRLETGYQQGQVSSNCVHYSTIHALHPHSF